MSDLENKIVKGKFGGGGSQSPPVSTPAYEDPEGLKYNGTTFSDYQFAQVKDLLSEGPIEGIVTGEYITSGTAGNLGYSQVKLKLNNSVATNDDSSRFLKSIYWNANPLVDSQDKFNYQQIDVSYTKGGPYGTDDQTSDLGTASFLRVINERLRGPNQLATTYDEITNFKKTYKIINRECNKLDINLRISSLYLTLKYQDYQSIYANVNNKENYPGVIGVTPNETAFVLDPVGRAANNSDTTHAGIGSVIEYKVEIRIQWRPIYKEGYGQGDVKDIVKSNAISLPETQDVSYTVTTVNGVASLKMEGKISQGYEKQISLDFSNFFTTLNNNPNWLGWEIVLLKTSPESTTSSRVAYITVDSINERYYSSYRYPNSSIVTSKFNAEYFSKIPDRSYDVRLLKVKVPSNYDPITKTYGNITGMPITITKEANQNFNTTYGEIYYSAFGTGYANLDNSNPPITDGLIIQFDANNATVGAGTNILNGWNNSVSTSSYKAVLGNGTYASPVGASNKPSKSGISANGKTGVTFNSTTQTVSFIDASTPTATGMHSNGNTSIFAVCQWDTGDNPTDYVKQRKIVKSVGSTNPSNWSLGFNNQYTRAFSFGSNNNFIFGPQATFQYTDNYSSKPERNTHIVGTVIRPESNNVDVFWDAENYSVLNDGTLIKAVPPVGLAINDVAGTSSYCTLFELLVYNRALTNSESKQVISWLNKKWNSYSTGVINSANALYAPAGSLDIASGSIKVPIRTVCGNGENTNDGSQTSSPFDLIPERYYKSWDSDWYLSNQGFCSFYTDFSFKLNQNLGNDTFGLVHRENQFNLSLITNSASDSATLSLKLFGGINTYNITKTLKSKLSSLKENFNKITVYIAPIVNRVDIKNNQETLSEWTTYKTQLQSSDGNTLLSPNLNAGMQKYKDASNLVLTANVYPIADTRNPSVVSSYGATLSYSYGTLPNGFPNLVNADNLIDDLLITEEIAPSSPIINFSGNCAKAINFSYQSFPMVSFPATPSRPATTVRYSNLIPGGNGYQYIPTITYDYFPDILNAKLVVLINNKEELIVKLNIADYNRYVNWIVNQAGYPVITDKYERAVNAIDHASESFLLAYLDRRSNLPSYTQSDKVKNAINEFNNKNTDFYIPNKNVTANLNSNQKTVTIGLNSDDIYNSSVSNVTPFAWINNTGTVELFTSKPSLGVNKISGYVDGIKIDKINFDRNTLLNVNNRSIFASQDGSTSITFTPNGVTGASLSNDLWDGTFKPDKQWTDNPAWCFYDLLTNKRYGAGNFVAESNVDKWSLYQIAKYCDELVPDGYGGVEPRFSFNTYITSQDDALKVLNDFASVFRGMFYYANGYIYAINDMPQTTPVYSFTNSNVVNGNFNYESTSIKDRNSACYVRYVDKTNLYKPAVEYVENIEAIRRYGLKETELTAFACTSRGQAQRLGRWVLASEYLETDTISFDAGPEASYIRPGDVIKIYDANKKYATVGGRTQAITLTVSGGNVSTTNPNAFTGLIALDRKIDFGIVSTGVYRFSLLAPTYNLDPSVVGAITGSSDFKDFRKSFLSPFLISSGSNIIVGNDYDSIIVSGSFTGLNYTGLMNFTGGASGYNPKGILWTLENNNQLDGTSKEDYDYYRVFKVQEASDSYTYTIFGTQVMNLKYSQIESGLNLLPNTKRIDPATAPDYVTFCLKAIKESNFVIELNINYNQASYENTIGFKTFIRPKQEYTSSFNPDKETDFTYTSIDITNPSVEQDIDNVPIDRYNSNLEIRVYGINALNYASSSYTVAYYEMDEDCIAFNDFTDIFDPNVQIDIRRRTNQTVLPEQSYGTTFLRTKLIVPLIYDFIKKDYSYNVYRPEINDNFYYRLVFLPEKVTTKAQFKSLYAKYRKNDPNRLYYYVEYKQRTSSTYDNIIKQGKFRNFSVGVDVAGGTFDNAPSSSLNFTSDQFKLISYDNQDLDLQADCLTLGSSPNTYKIDLDTQGNKRLNIDISQWTVSTNFDPYINFFWLLMVPESVNDFNFDNYYFVLTDNKIWTLYKKSGSPIIQDTLISDARLIKLPNKLTNQLYKISTTKDEFGNAFTINSYKGYIIAEDLTVDAKYPIPSPILEYNNQVLQGDTTVVSNFGPIFAPMPDIIQAPKVEGNDLYSIIQNAGTNYLHFVHNNDSIIEVRFNGAIKYLDDSANIQLKFDNIFYKPAQDNNLTAGQSDPTIFKDYNFDWSIFGSTFYNKTPIENKGINNSKFRDYKYNANKAFIGQIEKVSDEKDISIAYKNTTVSKWKVKNNDLHYGQPYNCDIVISSLSDHAGLSDFSSMTPEDSQKAGELYTNGYSLSSTIINDDYIEYINSLDPYYRNRSFHGVISAGEDSRFGYDLLNYPNPRPNIRHLTYNTNNCSSYLNSVSNTEVVEDGIQISTSSDHFFYLRDSSRDRKINEYTEFLRPFSLNNLPINIFNLDFPFLYRLQVRGYQEFYRSSYAFDVKEKCKITLYLFKDDGAPIYKETQIADPAKAELINGKRLVNLIFKNGGQPPVFFTPYNFFTYSNSYGSPIVCNQNNFQYFYKFEDVDQFQYAYLLPLKTQGTLAKHNFFIQVVEMSIVFVFEPINSTNIA